MGLDIFLGALVGVISNNVDMALVLGMLVGFLVSTFIAYILLTKKNPLEAYQLISSKGSDGIERPDINKVGQVVGIFLVCVVVLKLLWLITAVDVGGLVMVLGTALTYLGAVTVYASYLRSKNKPPLLTDDEAKGK